MIQVTPNEVKLAACKKKTASKAEMIEWATSHFPDAPWLTHKSKGELILSSKNEHLADALGAIVAGTKTDQFKYMMAAFKQTA